MFLIIYLGILLTMTSINCSPVPFVRNVTLIPQYRWNSTTVINHTIQQCLCLSQSSFIAFNWYPNNICQLFYAFPITYRIQSTPNARLYFPQGIFPNDSQCCMPDTDTLVNKLITANRTSITIQNPRCITFDNHGYLVTVSNALYRIIRFYSTNLSIVAQPISPPFDETPNSISYYDEKYYVGFDAFILIIDSNNLTILQNIAASVFNGIRDMAFLHNGQTLLALSCFSNSLVFLKRSDNYSLIIVQNVPYSTPHGLHIVNDSFFYVTSWNDNSINSYSAIPNSLFWTEQLVINAISMVPISGGSHLSIDNCGRYWFSLDTNGIRIFNNQGLFLRNITQIIPYIFDAILTDNYVLYISDRIHQIVRIDPNAPC